MDALVFITLALILALRPTNTSGISVGGTPIEKSQVEDITREAKLNDSYYEDANAFSEMINELGFPKEGR